MKWLRDRIKHIIIDVGYDIKDSSGKIYKNEVLPSYVTKEEPINAKEMSGYNVGDLIQGKFIREYLQN